MSKNQREASEAFVTWDEITNVFQYWLGQFDRVVMPPDKAPNRLEIFEALEKMKRQLMEIAERNSVRFEQARLSDIREVKRQERMKEIDTESSSKDQLQEWRERTRMGRIISTYER